MSEGKPKEMATPAAKNLMAVFQRGLTAITPVAPNQQGTRPRLRNGRRRHIIVPCSMHVEKFDDKTQRDERFRQLRSTKGARDVVKGYDVDKWYVAWNGKAA